MYTNRRKVLKGLGGVLSLPLLESGPDQASAAAPESTPTRLLVVGNPLGAHPEHFFPKTLARASRFRRRSSRSIG